MKHLKYKGYYGTVEYSTEDKVLHGKIVGINDLVTYESEHASDIEKEFKASVDDYIETCKQLGKEPNKAYSGTFNVRLKPTLHKEAVRIAEINHINLNDLVSSAVAYIVSNEDTFTLIGKSTSRQSVAVR